jgi:hypothetical protein
MKKVFIPAIVLLFFVLFAVFFLLQKSKPEYDFTVLMGGNVVMALLSILSFMLVSKQVGNSAQAFVRGVYSASFLKLMVCMISIFIYVMLNRKHIHKPTIFALFGIYAAYTFVETVLLSKMARDKQ